MEIQLQELIEQIKKEGVATAEAQAKDIIDAARKKAETMIADAREQADKILSDAKLQTERMTKSSEDAIRQSGRNLLISFRESVTRELKNILRENVESVYSSDDLGKLIVHIVQRLASDPDKDDILVVLNPGDLERLEERLLSELGGKLSKGITLKANDNFDGGFRISANQDGVFYDYSSEAVVDMLSNYLSPKVIELLKETK